MPQAAAHHLQQSAVGRTAVCSADVCRGATLRPPAVSTAFGAAPVLIPAAAAAPVLGPAGAGAAAASLAQTGGAQLSRLYFPSRRLYTGTVQEQMQQLW